MNPTIPPKLYKYQPYNVQTLDNLKNRQIWFSKPVRFNDPFDCHINYNVKLMTDKDWNKVFTFLKRLWLEEKDVQKKEAKAEYFNNDVPSDLFKSQFAKHAKSIIEDEIEGRFRQSGIACFSGKANDILMWSHYTDGHRGFCLEFDTRYLPFSKAIPVKYSKTLPSIEGKDLSDEILMGLAITKAKGWSYEDEWRIFLDKGDKEYVIDFNALTGVIFGCAMPKIHREVISLILHGSPTRLYEMEKSETKFEVGFYEIKYTPFDFTKGNK